MSLVTSGLNRALISAPSTPLWVSLKLLRYDGADLRPSSVEFEKRRPSRGDEPLRGREAAIIQLHFAHY